MRMISLLQHPPDVCINGVSFIEIVYAISIEDTPYREYSFILLAIYISMFDMLR